MTTATKSRQKGAGGEPATSGKDTANIALLRAVFDGESVNVEDIPERWRDLATESLPLATRVRQKLMLDTAADEANAGDPSLMLVLSGDTQTTATPQIFNAANWITVEYPPADVVLFDLLDVGCKAALIGSSKARKSFFLLQLALSVSTGRKMLNWCVPKARRVLLVQMEVPEYNFHARLTNMARGMGLVPAKLENLHIVNGRGWRNLMGDGAAALIEAAKKVQAELIIVDPLYKVLDGDENSAKDMKPALATFDNVCEQTGAALIFAHHNGKGVAGDRQTIDRGAGSGVLARDFDAAIYISDHQQEGLKAVETVARCYPPMNPFSVHWDLQQNCFVVDCTPATVKTSTGAKTPPLDPADLLDWIEGNGPLPKTTLKEQARESLGCSVRQFDAAFDALRTGERITQYRQGGQNGCTYWGTVRQIESLKQQAGE